MTMDMMLHDAFAALLDSAGTMAAVRAEEAGDGNAALAAAIEESGFLDALVPEEQGGAGLTLAALYPLVELCGARLTPYPFAETMIVRALMCGHESAPEGAVTFAAGVLPPLSLGAMHALMLEQGKAVFARVASTQRDGFGLQQAELASDTTSAGFDADPVALGAMVSAALMVGAMQSVTEIALTHANDRQQFGRPLGKFQAIQHQLAVMAEQVALARMASAAAFSGDLTRPDCWRIGVGKTLANEAADTVCALAHGILGAMGITQEHDLHHYTRRLKRWQLSFGSASYWSRELATRRLDSADDTVDFLRGKAA